MFIILVCCEDTLGAFADGPVEKLDIKFSQSPPKPVQQLTACVGKCVTRVDPTRPVSACIGSSVEMACLSFYQPLV